MKYFICVGHANYGGGVISSADGTSKGGVNEYKYNKELAPYVCKWLTAASDVYKRQQQDMRQPCVLLRKVSCIP